MVTPGDDILSAGFQTSPSENVWNNKCYHLAWSFIYQTYPEEYKSYLRSNRFALFKYICVNCRDGQLPPMYPLVHTWLCEKQKPGYFEYKICPID